MSLDVYLNRKGVQNLEPKEAIFIRENGSTKEISREEWDLNYPNREPIMVTIPSDNEQVFQRNITHNLGRMASQAGIYEHLWRPEELSITTANELISPLEKGLRQLKEDPEHFKKNNPENGWGDYQGLLDFVEEYLEACKLYPDASVEVSR